MTSSHLARRNAEPAQGGAEEEAGEGSGDGSRGAGKVEEMMLFSGDMHGVIKKWLLAGRKGAGEGSGGERRGETEAYQGAWDEADCTWNAHAGQVCVCAA